MDSYMEWGMYKATKRLSSTKQLFWLVSLPQNTSVGRFAIQLAKLSGLKVVTTASRKNWDRLKGLGADLVVDYKVWFR